METDYTLKLLIEAQDKFSSTFNSAIWTLKKSVAWLWISLTALWTVKWVVKLADNLEQAQIAFTTMLWSWEKANAMLKELSDFAKKTPFELTWVRSTAQQLIAMWVNAEEIIPTLKSLWDVSAWLSVPLERLALNYWQVIAQWKLTWRELRDFTMAWVPLLDELSRMLWKTTSQIQDMISKWQITSNDVVQAFQNMSSEWWKFADLMSKQATTLTWLRSNFQDSLNSLWEEIWMELLPSLKDYTTQLWQRLDNNIDTIKTVAKEVVDTAKVIADNVIMLVWDIWNALTTFAWFVNDISQWIADSTANSMTESSSATAQWLTWMAWNRHDFFYYVQQWITWIVSALRTALNTADSLVKTIWKKSFWNWLRNSWTVKVQKVEKWDNIFETIWNRFWEQKRQFSEWYKQTKEYLKDSFEWVKDTRNQWLNDTYQALEDNYVNQVAKLSWSIYSANQTVWTAIQSLNLSWTSALTDVGSWWSWKNSVEKMTEEMKDLIKEMNAYAKESEEMRKATYEWIIDWMEEAVKSAEKLADEIAELQEKINALNREETTDIASAYIKAEQTLKDYKKEYEDIIELANEYTKSELESKTKDRTVNWFSAKELIEVKNAYESMMSAFEWLDEEWAKSLQEQIDKQKAYNELNDVEKIKADYEEKRQVLQDELNEKVEAFETEMNKYHELTTQKTNYEKDWLDYMHYSYKEQKDMTADLINMYQRLAEAKTKAGMSEWIEWKAWWWDVYRWSSYLVWEHWPELFVPNQQWNIIPTNQITNNNWIEININGAVVRNDNDIQAIADEITRRIKLEKNFWIA